MGRYDEILELFQVEKAEGYSPEEVEKAVERVGRIPAELKDFFLTYGKTPELSGLQDDLLLPDRYKPFWDWEYIVFFVENQGVCQAGVKKSDAGLPDPPVYVSFDGGEWKKSAPSVSEFLTAMYGYQASLCLPFGPEELYWITPEEKEGIERTFAKRPQRFGHWLGEWDITLFGDNNEGRIALVENDEVIQLQYSANTEREFRRMRGYLESVGEPI